MAKIKEALANEYINLRKEFDGPDFKPGLFDAKKIAEEFKIEHLNDKIHAVKFALMERENRLRKNNEE